MPRNQFPLVNFEFLFTEDKGKSLVIQRRRKNF